MKKLIPILLILAALLGIAGAGVSVAMLIRAVEWSEWGRVIVYSVSLAVSVEISVLAIGKLRQKDNG